MIELSKLSLEISQSWVLQLFIQCHRLLDHVLLPCMIRASSRPYTIDIPYSCLLVYSEKAGSTPHLLASRRRIEGVRLPFSVSVNKMLINTLRNVSKKTAISRNCSLLHSHFTVRLSLKPLSPVKRRMIVDDS